jgi:DNA-binding MarR family transcriptional regulator
VTKNAKPSQKPTDDNVDEIVTAVLTASRVLVAVSARSLASIEDTVTLTQFRTLVVLDSHGEINLNRLADLLVVNSSTAMRMIDRLLAVNLVTRRDNPTNRREVLLGLTEQGRNLVREVTDKRRKEIVRIVTALPANQREGLVTALRALASAGGEPDAISPAPDGTADGVFGW